MRVISQMGNVKVRVDFSGTRGNYVIGKFQSRSVFRRRSSPPRWKPQANGALVKATRGIDGCLWSFRKSDLWRNFENWNWNYDGSGTLQWQTIGGLSGWFQNGQFSGTGKQFNENGVLLYEGLFRDGLYHGEGTLFRGNGSKYRGNGFLKPHGPVQFYFQIMAFSNMKVGWKKWTMEVLSFRDRDPFNQTGQSVYQGLWEDGTRSGNGTAWLEDGSIYSGNWVDDYPDERGPTFSWMGPNTRRIQPWKNMAKEPSRSRRIRQRWWMEGWSKVWKRAGQ